MGYNDEHAGRIILDIETAPLPDAATYLEAVEPPVNYKDPVKIEEFIRNKQREQLERASLDVDLCQVIAIGLMTPRDTDPLVMLGQYHSEVDMLTNAFTLIDESMIVGFNILDFDLAVLLRRALYLGIEA